VIAKNKEAKKIKGINKRKGLLVKIYVAGHGVAIGGMTNLVVPGEKELTKKYFPID